MATLKETRTRIASVKNTRQVTSAMKMVSAAKLRKVQGLYNKFYPYTDKQHHILENLARGIDEEDTTSPFFKEPAQTANVLIVAVSSNKGLCGALNANLIAETRERIAQYKEQNTKVALYTIGKKVYQTFKKTEDIIASNEEIQEELTYEKATVIANKLMDSFVSKQFDRIDFIYSHAKTASTQVATHEEYLPITPPEENDDVGDINYIFEPNKKEILEVLVPQMLRTQFYKTLLDALVAEHAARMIAMNKATDNAGDLLRELKLEYNKARQTAITNEILEIVSGAEALNKG
ncbi:ATP synthase F1 subcomplex gamma subunit [Balneicella halophila]|uniref:ATP synthase gamma chain n=1 Tax=Balneicella halophila TaxID=1537566 RepID=A0A7L4UP76_BALHA|nr:ATP synthase F1 subunit gamma [Balneicella halophila]PVX50918.1 ATP synthase F1 subcomplex gamma subunit [Balneicella halophila]